MMNDTLRRALIRMAEEQNEQFPQYREHWDEWVVGRIKTDIKTKLGLAFRRGDEVLVKPLIRDMSRVSFAKRADKRGVTAYSFRNRIDTGLWLSDIDVDTTGWRTVVEE